MANIDNVQLPDGSSYNIVDNTSGFATQNYVDSAVSSVTKTTIGLGNVDNTSDLNKPISTATQTALDTLDEDKADKTDIATVESGTTASRAYSVGELVYVSGTLYRVKTAIASGATFTVGTNVEVTNVSDAIAKFDRGSVSVTGNGIKTYSALLDSLYALIDTSKVTEKTYILAIAVSGNKHVFHVGDLFAAGYFQFYNVNVNTSRVATMGILLQSSGSTYNEWDASASGNAFTDYTPRPASNGDMFELHY